MRKIAVVTVARSDWGIYLPVLRCMREHKGVQLQIIVSGAHLVHQFGRTVDEVRNSGFEITATINFLLADDSPEAISKSLGLGIVSFAQHFQSCRPDLLVVLGDRYEMYAAALAALPFQIPVAHIHGGELSLGAIDDAIRHSLTKLSHLHFVACQEYARRVIQLGEEPWRVIISGAPALDAIRTFTPLPASEFQSRTGIDPNAGFLLVTYHPVTSEFKDAGFQIRELLTALDQFSMPILFTAPNADTCSHVIRDEILSYCKAHREAKYIAHCGPELYYSAMHYAAAMVGNSSSGIIEAPSFCLPVVNIGRRQEGRIRAGNVIDVGYSRGEIIGGIRRALSREFRESLQGLENPYGDGYAGERIANVVSSIPLDEKLLRKKFYDLPIAPDSNVQKRESGELKMIA
jgi:UDP-hydrolysing UDP-N-acetyl-D-glucosamine 2-epimerase